MKAYSPFAMISTCFIALIDACYSSPLQLPPTPDDGGDLGDGTTDIDCIISVVENPQGLACTHGSITTYDIPKGYSEAMAIDHESIYWITWTFNSQSDRVGSILKASKDGSQIGVLADNQESPKDLVVDSKYLYWTIPGETYPAKKIGSIMRISKNGGAAEELVSLGHPNRITLDDRNIYWTGQDDNHTGGVWKASKCGGMPTRLANDQGSPGGIIHNNGNLFWTNQGSEEIMKLELAGGGGAVVLSPQQGEQPTELITDGVSLFIGDAETGCISSIRLADGKKSNVFAPNSQTIGDDVIRSMAASDGWIYWRSFRWPGGPNSIHFSMIRMDGANFQVIATDPGWGLAIDSTQVFWVSHYKMHSQCK